MRLLAVTIALGLVSFSNASAADWLQWRGPNHNNVAAAGQVVPTKWSSTQNVLWKVSVPGRGHSSPTIVGGLIVLTSANEAQQQQGVFGFNRRTGKQQWGTLISQGGFPKVHNKNTHASATACSDGKQIYATFNHHNKIEAVALDLRGKVVWRKDVGGFVPRQYQYGYAAAPTASTRTAGSRAWWRFRRISARGRSEHVTDVRPDLLGDLAFLSCGIDPCQTGNL